MTSPPSSVAGLRDVATGLRRRVAQAGASSQAVIAALEAAGAHTVADRLDRRRSGGEIVAVRVPADVHDLRTRRVKALRRQGTDQCVEAFHQAGWWGYERPLPDVLLATLRAAGGTFFDVGANTGVYALIASTVPGVTVHAFEAYPPVARLMRENLALNRSGRRVRVLEVAVSDVVGEVELFVPPDSGLVETSSSTQEDFRAGSVPMRVPATTLDTHWSTSGRPRVTAVKLDVEGAEHRVLAGARELVAAQRPVLFVEVLPDAGFEELEAFRASLDLVDVRLSQWEAVVGDAVIHHALAWNHAFVPAERLELFVGGLPAAGLVVTRI
ncbi:MAG TPA: FkbM family methyltransferase [Actinotalea sp.]|jgi:FkbM family methyltransferase